MFQYHGQSWSKNAVAYGNGPTGEFGKGLPQISFEEGGVAIKMG